MVNFMTLSIPNLHLGCPKDEDKSNTSIGMLCHSPQANLPLSQNSRERFQVSSAPGCPQKQKKSYLQKNVPQFSFMIKIK